MCYTKPGPRCSKHARTALRAAKQNYEAASERLEEAKQSFEKTKDSAALAKLQEEKDRAAKALNEAKAEYVAKAEEKKKAYEKYKAAKKDWALTTEGIAAVRAKGDDEMADKLKAVRKGLIEASKNASTKKAEKPKPAPEAPKPVTKLEDYQRPHHRAPVADEDNAPLHDLSDMYGDDYIEHPEYYTSSSDDRELIQQLKKAKGNPDAKVKIYRALPVEHSHMNRGDWVALSREYADTHLTAIGSADNAGKWHVIEAEVPASSLWSEGNDLAEWGYDGDVIDTAPKKQETKPAGKGFKEVLKEQEAKRKNAPAPSPARAKYIAAGKKYHDLRLEHETLLYKALEDPAKYAGARLRTQTALHNARYAFEDSRAELEQFEKSNK